MSEPNTLPTNNGGWWLSNQGTPTGPHSEAFLLVSIKTGAISPQTYACRVGGQEWKRLCDLAAFASACPALPPPVPPLPPPIQTKRAPAPWDPQLIAWLGLLFSPLWAGIMAAINARRLRTALPIWRPIAIAIGATLLDVVFVANLTYSVVPDLCLYLATLWVIWWVDLRPQCAAFTSWHESGNPSDAWLWPGLAGSPLALVVLLTFVVGPLLPLEPRQVCERFVAASSLNEAKKYTATNLWPALVPMYAQKDDPDFSGRIDLTDEADAPMDVGGRLVGCRMYGEPKGEAAFVVDGFFHLKETDGTWKIEDWYFTSFNNEAAESPVSLALNYKQLFPAPPPAASRTVAASSDSSKKAVVAARGGWALTRWLFGSEGKSVASAEAKALAAEGRVVTAEAKGLSNVLAGGAKRIGVFLAAVAAGVAALGRFLFGNKTSSMSSPQGRTTG